MPFYDRTALIQETLGTLSSALYQQILIAFLVVLLMLRSLRSSALVALLLPLGTLFAFILMRLTGVDANVMALGGIAIAIGAMVDIGIVFVENIMHRRPASAANIKDAMAEVAPAVLTAVLTTVVSFLPVFGLPSRELKLFAPLAFTKAFAMLAALGCALFLLPALASVVLRYRQGRGHGPESSPESRPESSPESSPEYGPEYRPEYSHAFTLRGVKPWNALILVLVTGLLAQAWLPLGQEKGLVLNGCFVGMLLGGVFVTFGAFQSLYPRLLGAFLRRKLLFLCAPLCILVVGLGCWLGLPQGLPGPLGAIGRLFPGLGREYMPAFDEGAYLYMPTTMPHASMGEALRMLSKMDAAIARIPEVNRVVGKLGRVDSALDPAPVSMVETYISYKPEYALQGTAGRVRQWRPHISSPKDIWEEILHAAEYPGVTRAPPLMPIQARLVMLQSGMRAPLGMRVYGPSLEAIAAFSLRLEGILKGVSALRAETVFADRVVGKPYVEIALDREAIGRYGLTVGDVQRVLQLALGGVTLTHTLEGRARYPVRVRYLREERDSFEALERLVLPTPQGEYIPISQLASIEVVRGPQAIRAENGFLVSYVLFDRQPSIAAVEAVEEARAVIEGHIKGGMLRVPEGVRYEFAGSYALQQASERRLMLLIPLALVLVFMLLYLKFRRMSTCAIIFSGVGVAAAGGFMLLWLYGQPWFLDFEVFGTSMRQLFRVGPVNLSVAVWVGFIALVGIASDDGVLLSSALKRRLEGAPPRSIEALRQCVLEAGSRRLRPCLMTTATTLLALLPVITSQGRGADMLMPMALPALGGMGIALITVFVVPVLHCALEEYKLRKHGPGDASPAAQQ